MMQEWDNGGAPMPPGYRGNPQTWQIWDWAKVFGSCARDDGDLTFDSESVKVIPLLWYLDNKLGKYADTTNIRSYVELLRNRTRANVATTSVAVEKERQLQEAEAKYEASRIAFNKESRRVDELTADLAKKDQAHADKVPAKKKTLAEWEATRTSDEERIEKLLGLDRKSDSKATSDSPDVMPVRSSHQSE
ncbi:hypothetical protein AXG93_1311s1000 [Marchantia polymorpha subsp. ruderalis]|uniref:Uncharacterized protein n=1 Tax=Marchantia polymorpha subsp. ruderalis TaxID=1480154 RepID=A0A176VTU8_MARPO|nr:hypothetical protein AXG93_1311s1000 [Marchantia polymorpha subsp. ruderalis]